MSPVTGPDSGLLLAYIGFQRGNPAEIEEGLAAVGAHGDLPDQRMAEMLRGVWLEPVEEPADDSGAPADGG